MALETTNSGSIYSGISSSVHLADLSLPLLSCSLLASSPESTKDEIFIFIFLGGLTKNELLLTGR